jgi:hypothetical protein
MSPANLSMIAFFALIAWRLVFAGLHRRLLVRTTAPQQQRRNNPLEQGLHILDLAGVAVIPDNCFENRSDVYTPSPQKIARKDICAASLPSLAPRKWMMLMSWMSARCDFMCAIDMSGGCET